MSLGTIGNSRFGGALFGGLAFPIFSPAPPTPPASFFEVDLLSYLKATTGLLVYPGHIPQKVALPALSFLLVGSDRSSQLSGSAGLADHRIQITASSRSFMDVGQISQTLMVALLGFRGFMGSTRVFNVTLANQISQFQASVDASDKGIHSKINEYLFEVKELIPTFPSF